MDGNTGNRSGSLVEFGADDQIAKRSTGENRAGAEQLTHVLTKSQEQQSKDVEDTVLVCNRLERRKMILFKRKHQSKKSVFVEIDWYRVCSCTCIQVCAYASNMFDTVTVTNKAAGLLKK